MTGRPLDRVVAVDADTPPIPQPANERPGELEPLSGWGLRPVTNSEIVQPKTVADLHELEPLAMGQISRGLGRSYGDAAQLAGGTVIDMTAMSGLQLDVEGGLVTAKGGTSLGEILEYTIPHGWFLPVTPGTRHVTVGGAVAADVHGKNHHRDGSFGQYVTSLELITGDRQTMVVVPGTETFSATLGGMGLTGTITKATFQLTPVETTSMVVDTRRAPDLSSVMEQLADADSQHRYSVAWLDLTRRGKGRGIVMGGDHARSVEAPAGLRDADLAGPTIRIPGATPALVNRVTVNVFNQIWYAKAPRNVSRGVESMGSFFYPLDGLTAWNRLYGDSGFLQYQFVVPYGEESTLVAVAETLVATPTPVSLAVLKRMGDSVGGYLSFPMPGWTLAVDMPLGDPRLGAVLDRCDERVADAGGRVYLAKDSRLRRDIAHEMYPDLAKWREVQAKLDPARRLRSNLSERLELIA